MQKDHLPLPLPFITSENFLQIVVDSYQDYDENSNFESFHSFLRDQVFTRLGNVFVDIYFKEEGKDIFLPCPGRHPHTNTRNTPQIPPQIPAGEPLLEDLFTRHTSRVFSNNTDTPSFLVATGNQVHALFPIVTGEKTRALLYVGCSEARVFPKDYLQGIHTVTEMIGFRMKNIDVISHLKDSVADLEYSERLQQALFEISEKTQQQTGEEELFSALHEIVGRFINASNFFIALREKRDGDYYIRFIYFFDEMDSHLEGKEFKIDPKAKPSVTGFIIKSGKPLLLGPDEFDRFCLENDIKYLGTKSHSLIGAPFYLDDLDGVVLVQSYSDVVYTEKDKDLLVYVARHIGDALGRKKTIDDMRNANEIFSLFMRYSPAYIIIKEVTESSNRVLQASENYRDIIGKPGSEIIGKNTTELFSADFAAKVVADDWQVVSSESPLHVEQYFNGRTYTSIKFPITQGGKTLLAAFSIDITKRKQMEEALRKSELRYRIIFEKSPLGVISFDSKGKVIDFNERFVEIMGSTREKILGFNAAEQSTPIVIETLKKAIAGKIAYCEDSYTSVTGDKTSLLRGIFSPVIPGQSPTDVIATIEDITEQKEREKELHKIEKLESLGILAGGIAHDFNNILTGIMANISFAKIFLDPNHKSAKSLTEAEKASKRAAELAKQLLTFAKGGEPNKKVIPVQRLIREAVSLMLRGTNVRPILDVPDSIHAIQADEGQISQILNNMIINATQAMPGGGNLSISAKNAAMLESNPFNLKNGSYVKVILRDDGCGISKENRGKIFDPYFTTKIAGTGLGLSSVYSIISRHNGHITVDSTVGQGTEFTIYLPSIGGSSEEHLTAVSPTGNSRTGGTILVMDDEEMIRNIARDMLTHLGYEVTTCTKGEETIELFKESLDSNKPYWAVIVDLTIPGGLGGMQTAEYILSMSPTACLIVSSGYSNDPIMADYRKYGFSAAIAKPYSIGEFEQVLNSLPAN
ncbi:MAG: PAS domain S-box protein [Desulforhopalus sp.]